MRSWTRLLGCVAAVSVAIALAGCPKEAQTPPPPAPGKAATDAGGAEKQATPFEEVEPGLGLPVYAEAERQPAKDRGEARTEAEAEMKELLQGAAIDELKVDAYATDDDWKKVAAWYGGRLGKGWAKTEEDQKIGFLKTDAANGEIVGVSVAHHSATGRTAIGFMRVKSAALKGTPGTPKTGS